MNKLVIFFIIVTIGVASCNKDDIEYSNFKSGQTLFEFKADMKNTEICSCLPFIGEYVLKGETYYKYGVRGPNCDYSSLTCIEGNCGFLALVWDKSGNPIRVRATFLDEAEFVKYNYEFTCNDANQPQ